MSTLPAHIRPLTELDAVWRARSAGERYQAIAPAAAAFRERLFASGRVAGVRTCDLVTFPYPTRFALGGAAYPLAPYVMMTNRVNVVQFDTDDGERKTLLFNPTDYERSSETPFFAALRRRYGDFVSDRLLSTKGPKPQEHLAALGLRPEDVDYIAFDHMHTQDVRPLIGTTAPALGAQTPLKALYPNAKLLIWRPELELFRALHPLQESWYIRDGVRDVPEDRLVVCDGDLLLGKGVALARTPGHTVGNWSLVLNCESGVWAVSENGVAADAYAPLCSRIPGVRRHCKRYGLEVVLNSNTLELRNEQYTSMVLERQIVDRCGAAPDFHQHLSSSELTASPLAPGLAPTYSHGGLSSGKLRSHHDQFAHEAA